MKAKDFRRIALGLNGAVEKEHMGHPDFRVAGKIFATLFSPDGDEQQGMVKLTPQQQTQFVRDKPDVFEPVKGGWGRKGCTQVRLAAADRVTVRSALLTAWLNTAPKRLIDTMDHSDAE